MFETVVLTVDEPIWAITRNAYGRAVVKGIRTDVIASRHAAGDSIEMLADDYDDLTVDDVRAAIDYEAERAARREAKKAKRKDPIRRQLKANGRACRNRGRDFEKLVTARIARFGFKRVPGSGMFGGSLSGDIRRECTYLTLRRDDGVTWSNGPASVRKIECKRQEAEQRFVRAALAQGGGSQVVVIGKPGIEPIAYMELAQLEHLLREAGYEVTG